MQQWEGLTFPLTSGQLPSDLLTQMLPVSYKYMFPTGSQSLTETQLGHISEAWQGSGLEKSRADDFTRFDQFLLLRICHKSSWDAEMEAWSNDFWMTHWWYG